MPVNLTPLDRTVASQTGDSPRAVGRLAYRTNVTCPPALDPSTEEFHP